MLKVLRLTGLHNTLCAQAVDLYGPFVREKFLTTRTPDKTSPGGYAKAEGRGDYCK